MNLIDIIAAIAVGWGIIRGFANGLIRELAGLLGIIIGVWLGLRLAFIFADYYRTHWEVPEKAIPMLAFFTGFILALVGIFLLSRILDKILDAAMLTVINKAAGAVFGALKWAFIVGTFFSILGNSGILPETTQDDSFSYPFLSGYCKTVNQYSIGLIPAAKDVFTDMETYFTGIDSAKGLTDSLATDSLSAAHP